MSETAIQAEPSTQMCKAYSEGELAEAETDLRTWVETFHAAALDYHEQGEAYAKRSPKGWKFFTDKYLTDCVRYFGSVTTGSWRAARSTAKSQLVRHLEPNMALRKPETNWQEAQVIFYAWTRKGYENALKKDKRTGDNIPDLIRAGQSQKLKDALPSRGSARL